MFPKRPAHQRAGDAGTWRRPCAEPDTAASKWLQSAEQPQATPVQESQLIPAEGAGRLRAISWPDTKEKQRHNWRVLCRSATADSPKAATRILGDLAHIRGGGKAIVLTLRGDGVPTEAERGTASVGADGGGASVAATATLPEPAFCSCGFCSGRQRQPAVTRRGTGASHLLGWSNGLIADIARGA
jgi:hypothetical protein